MKEPYHSYALNDATHWEWHLTFVGQYMQHNYRLYAILDDLFKSINGVGSIVEIGTGNGALTTYLALWGLKLGINVVTLDKDRPASSPLLAQLNVVVLTGDENDVEIHKVIKSLIGTAPCVFICDGGHKQDELALWSRMLPKGSIIAAHDLGYEFLHERAVAMNLPIVPVMRSRWMEMNAQIAIYQVQ